MIRPGDKIGPFRIQRSIGSGGFATVFLADDDRFRKPVAIKVLADNHANSPDLRQRFFDEGHLLRTVDSEAIVTVHDIGEQDGQPYLVLDYANRGDLAARVDQRGTAPTIDDVQMLVRQVGTALHDLEAAKIAHRDIKPSNILLTSRPSVPMDAEPTELRIFSPDDRLLLGDLGLAKNLGAGSGITLGSGTGSFAAPEQRQWLGTISLATDIYGASALIHWFVTGLPPGVDPPALDLPEPVAIRVDRPALTARGMAASAPKAAPGPETSVVEGRPLEIPPSGRLESELRAMLTAALRPALDRGLADEPADRHGSAAEWTSDLLDRLDSADSEQATVPIPSAAPITTTTTNVPDSSTEAPSALAPRTEATRDTRISSPTGGPDRHRRRRGAAIAAATAAAVAVATAAWLINPDESDPAAAPVTGSTTSGQGNDSSTIIVPSTATDPNDTGSDEGETPSTSVGSIDIAESDLTGEPVALSPARTPPNLVDTVVFGLDGIEDDITFSPGSADLENTGLVDRLADVLATGVLVELRGHDDGDGNVSLGEDRARAVQTYLIDEAGMAPELLLVIGAEAERDDQRGTVSVIVRDLGDGGLLLSHWNSVPTEWIDPAAQSVVPGVRTVFNGCTGVCAVQVEGWLTPTDSGDHQFELRADEPAELWMSSSADPSDLRPVLRTDGESVDGRATAVVSLVAGRPVYVRLRSVDGGGDDGAIVVWQDPSTDASEWVSPLVLSPPAVE